MPVDFPERIVQANRRIRPDAKRTPLEFSEPLSRITGAAVFLKWENEQLTGSFKFRGALNRLRLLSSAEKAKGVVSASTGNHGLGISLAAKIEGVELTLVLPAHVSSHKKSRLEEYGTAVIEYGNSCEKAELQARRLAGKTGRVFVSPYNDEDIICGQGTIGLEILDELPGVEAVLVPVGGGGLASGIGAFLKAARKEIKIFGVEPLHSAFMEASLKAGKIIDIEEKETIADAVAGGIEPGSVTFDICRRLLEGIIVVEEARIAAAMSLLYERHQKVVEGAGALALAALMKESPRFEGRTVALVISGGNIAPETFKKVALLQLFEYDS